MTLSSAARRREVFRRRLLETRESFSDEEHQEAEGARDPDGGSDEDDA